MSLHCSQFSLGRLLPPEGEIGKGIRTSAVTKTKRPGVKENVKSAVTGAAGARSGGIYETGTIIGKGAKEANPGVKENVKDAVTGASAARSGEGEGNFRRNGSRVNFYQRTISV